MTGRVEQMVRLTEKALLLKPEWQRRITVALLNLLRIRKDETYRAGLDNLVRSAREMQKNPALEAESDLVLSEAEIAEAFPKLTKPEAVELEKYLVSLLLKGGHSLAAYLAEKLDGVVGDYWNITHFRDPHAKAFAMLRNMNNAADEKREEDFALRGMRPVTYVDLFLLIKDYYAGQGYEFLSELLKCSIMLRKGEKAISVVVTKSDAEILVTVNVLTV